MCLALPAASQVASSTFGCSATTTERGAGLAEQLGLGKRFRPVADDDDGRAFYPHKDREGVELGGMLRQVGTPDTKPPF